MCKPPLHPPKKNDIPATKWSGWLSICNTSLSLASYMRLHGLHAHCFARRKITVAWQERLLLFKCGIPLCLKDSREEKRKKEGRHWVISQHFSVQHEQRTQPDVLSFQYEAENYYNGEIRWHLCSLISYFFLFSFLFFLTPLSVSSPGPGSVGWAHFAVFSLFK